MPVRYMHEIIGGVDGENGPSNTDPWQGNEPVLVGGRWSVFLWPLDFFLGDCIRPP